MDEIKWGSSLAANPNSIELWEEHDYMIDIKMMFILASNPSAIDLLKANMNIVNNAPSDDQEQFWEQLSANPNAIDMLKANRDKIDWDYLSSNPNAINL